MIASHRKLFRTSIQQQDSSNVCICLLFARDPSQCSWYGREFSKRWEKLNRCFSCRLWKNVSYYRLEDLCCWRNQGGLCWSQFCQCWSSGACATHQWFQFVISNSFHATAFSLILEKNFCVVNRKESINERMKSVLADYGLETRMVSQYSSSLVADIDYTNVNKIMHNIIVESQSWVNNAIERYTKWNHLHLEKINQK